MQRDYVNKLIKFAKKYHPAYRAITNTALRKLFKVYENTTLVWRENGEIKGFAVYQEWPDRLHFIAIAGSGTWQENLRAMLAGRHNLPNKKISFFNEEKMELKELCQ